MTGQDRRLPIFGAEPWTTVAGVEWCHFDWWFSLVITTDFDADADAPRRHLETTLRSTLHRRSDVQAKLSHLTDLRSRLDAAGLGFGHLAEAEEPDTRVLAKARRKVFEQELDGRAMTDAMRDTPARRLEQRARYGYWDRFPSNPTLFYERLAGRRNDTFVPTGQAEPVETILLELEAEYRGAYEDHQADEAIELIAWLHVAGRRYTKYVETAHRLGSDHWRPIVALAESAIAGNRPELATGVFRSADQPGHHRDHLRTKCVQLTGVSLSDRQGPMWAPESE